MCDKEHFEKLEGRVDDLEKAHREHEAEAREKFKSNEKLMNLLITCIKWTVGGMFLMLLLFGLAVIYGAVGEHGFNHVTRAAEELSK